MCRAAKNDINVRVEDRLFESEDNGWESYEELLRWSCCTSHVRNGTKKYLCLEEFKREALVKAKLWSRC